MTVLIGFILIICIFIVFNKVSALRSEVEAQKLVIFNYLDRLRNLSNEVELLKQQLNENVAQNDRLEEVPEEIDIVVSSEITKPVITFNVDEKSIFDTEFPVDESDVKLENVFANETKKNPQGYVELKPSLKIKKEPLINFDSENWMGINLLNRLGAILIVIGAIATAAFDGIPAVIRTFILFAFAVSVLVLGEVMNKKKPSTASIGVTAVGVALLYVAVAAGYFVLLTLGMYTALIACIFATIVGLCLAIRYDEQVVAIFALVGGYLPILALDPFNDALAVGLVGYFILLTIFTLTLALSKKWSISNFIGLGLTIIGTTYLGFQARPFIALTYACFAFLSYTALPLIATYRSKESFKNDDVILVVINAFVSSIIVFLIATRLNSSYVHTILTIVFAVIYGGLAYVIKVVFAHKEMSLVFLLKALGFAVLFVPFTFDYRWFAIAWLVEAMILISYGILMKKKISEYVGFGIYGLSGISFLANTIYRNSAQITFDYTFLTLGLLCALVMYILQQRQWGSNVKLFKFVCLTNLWIYFLYLTFNYLPNNYFSVIVAIACSLSLAFIYVKYKKIADTTTHVITGIMHVFCLILLLYSDIEFSLDFGLLSVNLLIALICSIMVIYYQKTETNNSFVTIYKSINLANVLFMTLLVVDDLTFNFEGSGLLLIGVTFIFALTIGKIRFIYDNGVGVLKKILQIIGLFALLLVNMSTYKSMILLLTINAIVQILALLSLNDLSKNFKNAKGSESPYKILILSGYFLLVVTQGVMVQAQIAFTSAIISILFVLTSFAWIILGFYLKNKPVRKFGLYLSIASVVKLLVVDTWGLSTGMRIVSYFTLGVVLMIISFIYQKFNKDETDDN